MWNVKCSSHESILDSSIESFWRRRTLQSAGATCTGISARQRCSPKHRVRSNHACLPTVTAAWGLIAMERTLCLQVSIQYKTNQTWTFLNFSTLQTKRRSTAAAWVASLAGETQKQCSINVASTQHLLRYTSRSFSKWARQNQLFLAWLFKMCLRMSASCWIVCFSFRFGRFKLLIRR